MAISRCAKCNGTFFELVAKEPTGSRVKIMFVQCSSCGAPVGTEDYYSVGSLLKGQEEEIEKLHRKVDNLETMLRRIMQALR